ncbi:MAG TPA: hypothetical protein VFU47_01425, partial [Armatimonadota bacterium]|nr:hypothetical protein [Armatimonadota bacterium]
KKKYTAEPPLWFHDIFRTDGSAYIPAEVQLIQQLTGKARARGASPKSRADGSRVPVLTGAR